MDVQLKVILGKQKGHLLNFGTGEFLIGRGAECHVRTDSPLVSRQHCMLRVQGEQAWLRDLGSANGTLVNHSLLNEERPLRHGDKLQLGPLVLEVVLSDPLTRTVECEALSKTVEVESGD
jgi:pSer/pThr/pTyr-binding forkhead associated (FHA) protein